MAVTYRPNEEEIIQGIINGVKGEAPAVNDGEFFCLDFTSFCSGTCLYCEKSRDNWDLKRSRMTAEEIVDGLRPPYESGIRNFLVYGGADLYFDREKVTGIIGMIKQAFPDSVLYMAIGDKVFEDYTAYKEAGLDGYVLFHRSADAEHFARIHTLESYPDFRMKMLPLLRETGLKIGTGITVGWPYQTAQILAKDVEFVMGLDPDVVVIEAFLPEKDTEFEGFPKGDRKQKDKVIKLVRKILPDAQILTHL